MASELPEPKIELEIISPAEGVTLVGEVHKRTNDDITMDAEFMDAIEGADVLLVEAKPMSKFPIPNFTQMGNYVFLEAKKPVIYMDEILEGMGIVGDSDSFSDDELITNRETLAIIDLLSRLMPYIVQNRPLNISKERYLEEFPSTSISEKLFAIISSENGMRIILKAIKGIHDYHKLYRDFKYTDIVKVMREKYKSIAIVVGRSHLPEMNQLLSGEESIELKKELKYLSQIVEIQIGTVMDMIGDDVMSS